MNDDEFKKNVEELIASIRQSLEALPPEYAKISLRLFAENILEKAINLPENLNYEEAQQEIIKLIFDEIKRAVSETGENQFTVKPVGKRKRIPAKNVIQKRAESIVSPEDKVTDALFGALANFNNEKFYNQEGNIKLKAGEINGEPVRVLVQINIDDLLKQNPEIFITRELNLFDSSIHRAVISLNLANNDVININQICRVLLGYGRYEDRPAPPALVKAVKESLHRLRYTSIRINATEEAERFNYSGLKKMKRAVFEGYLLPLNSVEVEFNNGQVSEAYEILKMPPLYSYANAKNQVSNVKIEYLQLPDKMEATAQSIVIRDYLMQQIEAMKNPHNHRNNIIAFDTLYKILDVDNANANTVRIVKQRIRSTVEALLLNWIQQGYIAGREYHYEGRKIAKVAITLANTALKSSK